MGDKRSAPAYTISGRNKEPLDERVKNPGPGQYNGVDPESYKARHSPAYTISGRTNIPTDDTTPGPGVYSPEKVIHSVCLHFKWIKLFFCVTSRWLAIYVMHQAIRSVYAIHRI